LGKVRVPAIATLPLLLLEAATEVLLGLLKSLGLRLVKALHLDARVLVEHVGAVCKVKILVASEDVIRGNERLETHPTQRKRDQRQTILREGKETYF